MSKPTPQELDEAEVTIRVLLGELHEAYYEQRVASAARDLARAQARMKRAEVERLQRKLERAKAGAR